MNPASGALSSEDGPVSLLYRVAGPIVPIELLVAITILLLAFFAPRLGARFATGIEQRLAAARFSPAADILAIGLLAVLLRALILPLQGPALPIAHDEYSLLFQAETFLAGRLANPTPPFWEHFESIHLNVLPAYASMYFPGRSLPLAAGILVGHPWTGVWATFTAMCMAAVWMLQGWVSRPLALLGGVLVILRLGIFGYWINSYWGGAFSALGAMLLVGALPRLLDRPTWGVGILMGVGAAILVVTRPFEGALLCIPLAVFLLFRMMRSEAARARAILVKAGLPVVLLVAASGGWLLAFNKATTGDALVFPYDMNRQTYAITPAFLVQDPIEGERRGPPHFRPFYEWENLSYKTKETWWSLTRLTVGKVYYVWMLAVGIVLAPAFLAGLWVALWARPVLPATLVFFGIGHLFQTWHFAHYVAPILSVTLVITMMGFGWLRTWTPRGRPTGLFLTRAMPVGVLLPLLLPAAAVASNRPSMLGIPVYQLPCCQLVRSNAREQIATFLEKQPGKHIVLVSTDAARHPVHTPMIYNAPDMEASRIIWAHRLGPERDAPLLDHFAGRRAWQVEWRDDGTHVLLPRHSVPEAR